ncbi:MAG: hypothetical protein JW797_13110 [Bradymonadales bacterium]|nr:hypothetical protein [Bradymonadales bacterium]
MSREIFLAAKRSILSFTEAMSFEQFDRAYTLLSNETRILLDDLSPTGRGESVLSDGIIERGGAQYTIDPVDLFVIRNLEEILDTQPDRMEAETTRRKEVYAISQEGDVHHLVVILEEDRWLIHKPEIELTPGAPGRRTTGE